LEFRGSLGVISVDLKG
jgi:hypothetical protein